MGCYPSHLFYFFRMNSGFTAAMKSRSRCYKEPSEISMNGRVNSESIPIDLVFEILSRLPAKFIGRCRCVSKLWASILRRPDFTELFLTRSQARPQLLFTCHKDDTSELFFFSSPHPQYSDASSSVVTTASYRMKIPFNCQYDLFWHIDCLVFLRDVLILDGRETRALVSIICNPSTGQSQVLSKLSSLNRNGQFNYLGYDRIEKQFKVLSMTATIGAYGDHQVLTLGTKEMSWRKVECCISHFPTRSMICINGVLYYQAYDSEGTMIISFDISSEKLCFMKVSSEKLCFDITGMRANLINYNGKLGSLVSDGSRFSGRSRKFVLWILEDTEKHEWSKHIHFFPPLWKDVVGNISVLDVVGMVGANEIVFSPHTHTLPFYVFYYNIERRTIKRVEIQGLEGSKGKRVHTFLNHVEDIKPIDEYYRSHGGFEIG